jgi:streptogramin lyase
VRKLLETSQTHRYLYLHLVQHLARLGLTLLLLGVVTLEGAVDLSAQIPIAQTYHKSWTPRDGAPNNIEDIARGGDGFLWLTTDDGLYRFDGVSFERYTSRDGSRLPSEHLIAIAATRDGSIWVSYATGGIGRIKNGQVANFGEGDGLRRGQISQLLEDKDGSVWAKGTAGLQVITQSKVTQIGAESGLPAETAGWLATDNDGNLWVPLQRALMVLPHGAKRFLVVPREKYEAPSVCRPGREAGVWCWTFNGNGPIRWFRLSGSSIHQVPVAEGVRPRGLLLANDGTVFPLALALCPEFAVRNWNASRVAKVSPATSRSRFSKIVREAYGSRRQEAWINFVRFRSELWIWDKGLPSYFPSEKAIRRLSLPPITLSS